jgi:feruloyl esterase
MTFGKTIQFPVQSERMTVRRLAATAAACLTVLSFAGSASAAPCDELLQLKVQDATIDSAQAVVAGSYRASPADELKDMPAFCRLHGTIAAVTGSRVGFELWLPDAGWNGKIEMFGNGGYSSKIAYLSLGEQLKRGYSVLGTDTGHSGNDPDFASGHPEAIIDWGHRAVHVSIVAAKPIVTAFYGRSAQRAYFSGCSTGGHQALMEAQRYPQDFDGIIAGDPGNNRTHLNAGFLWQFVSNHRKDAGATPIIPPTKLAMISAAVIKACRGRDGGLATDPFLTDPEACGFQPKDLLCKAGDAADCLTQEQADTLSTMYGGARNPRTGEVIYYGWPKGSENSGQTVKALPGWSLYWADPADATRPARSNFWKLWAFDDPGWDWSSFDFDAGMKAVDARLASAINAMNPDLSQFAGRGGKLIQYHGLADPVVPPRDSIDYFERVQAFEAKSKEAPATSAPTTIGCFWFRGWSIAGTAKEPMCSTPSRRWRTGSKTAGPLPPLLPRNSSMTNAKTASPSAVRCAPIRTRPSSAGRAIRTTQPTSRANRRGAMRARWFRRRICTESDGDPGREASPLITTVRGGTSTPDKTEPSSMVASTSLSPTPTFQSPPPSKGPDQVIPLAIDPEALHDTGAGGRSTPAKIKHLNAPPVDWEVSVFWFAVPSSVHSAGPASMDCNLPATKSVA